MSTQSTNNSAPIISDLTFVVAWSVLTVVAIMLDAPLAVRGPLGVGSALLLPGYAVIAALFPAGSTQLSEVTAADGISLLERAVLSVGVSLTVLALSGIGLNRILGSIPTETLLAGVLTITIVSVAVASIRRRLVQADERYAPSISFSAMRSRPDALVILLAVSVLFAGGAVAYGELGTNQSTSLTEFYFVTDSGNSSEGYTTTFDSDTATPMSLAIGNSEGEEMTYTVIGQLQQAEQQDGTVVVEGRLELSRDRIRVPAGTARQLNTTVEPDASEGSYRLVYLLYKDDPPEDPEISNAYREIHLWIEVT